MTGRGRAARRRERRQARRNFYELMHLPSWSLFDGSEERTSQSGGIIYGKAPLSGAPDTGQFQWADLQLMREIGQGIFTPQGTRPTRVQMARAMRLRRMGFIEWHGSDAPLLLTLTASGRSWITTS